jgi:FkbM family methyltransferase
MFKALKSKLSSQLQKWLITTNPEAYKKRYLGHYTNLSWKNFDEKKVEYEMLLLPYFLDKHSVFFDIGSNIGSFILIAGKVLPQEQIYGFEPIPELNKRLKVLFPKANISSLALSNKCVNTQFKIPKINHTHLLTRGTLNTSFLEANEQGSITIDVQTDTLDSFTSKNNIQRVDAIKIDVEGHEHEVIKGALCSFKAYMPVLIIEIEQRHHQQDISLIINDLKQIGYNCFYFNSNTFQIEELIDDPKSLQDASHFEKSRKYIHNFIFVPYSKVKANYITAINSKINADSKQ